MGNDYRKALEQFYGAAVPKYTRKLQTVGLKNGQHVATDTRNTDHAAGLFTQNKSHENSDTIKKVGPGFHMSS